MKEINFSDFSVANDAPFVLIAGPCQIESEDHTLYMAEEILKITTKLNIPLIFKSSFDKANRTSATSKRGIGMYNGLDALNQVKQQFGIPVLTDIHEIMQTAQVSQYVDVLQIPAFLSRQTDLLEAAAISGLPVHIKKGQWMAPKDMHQVAAKLEHFGCRKIMLCDRGTAFGYNTLVNDMRGLPIMAETGWPVIIDATHSVQQPGGLGGSSGGQREYVETIARAGVAVGVAGVFIETHQDPDSAPSDGPNMVPLNKLYTLLEKLKDIDTIVKGW